MKSAWFVRINLIAVLVLLWCVIAQGQTYFVEDFEKGVLEDNWEVSGHDWSLHKADSVKAPHDALDKRCLWSNQGGNYDNHINTSATLIKAIDIRASIQPVLSFWMRNSLAFGDAVYLERSTDNGFTWKELWSRGESVYNSWHKISIDLALEKQNIFIFRFRISTNYINVSWGCLIDNIIINEFDLGDKIALPFQDNFEDGMANFKDISGHDWGVTDETAQEGSFCLTDSPKRNYSAYSYSRATIKGYFHLAQNGNHILSMWHKYYLSYGETIKIQVSTDSGWTWQSIASWGEGTLNSWQKVQIDLSQFNGKRINIAFQFSSNYINENNGWFIDNLKIYDAANENPLIDTFSASTQQGYKPLPVQFTCQSHDPDGSISEYRWDLDGDGRPDTTTTTGSVGCTYQNAGIYEATCTAVDNGGATATSQKLRIFVLSGDDRRISAADTAAASGTLVKLAIRIDNASGLAALQGRLRFNPAILEATKIETSTVTSGFSLADSLMPGRAAFSLARATALPSGSGDLLYFTLLVKIDAQPGDTCSLALENMRLFGENNEAIPLAIQQGLFTVSGSSGSTGFYIQPDTLILVPGQAINLHSFIRAVDGQIAAAAADWTLEPLSEIGKTRIVGTLSDINGVQVTLQTKRIGDGRIIARSGAQTDTAWVCVKGMPGDITADSLIMANDASHILRASISLPLAPLPPGHVKMTLYDSLAADFNADRKVNVDDAKLVLDKSLGNILKRTGMHGSGPVLAFISSAQTSGNDLLYQVNLKLRDDITATRIALSYDANQMTLTGVVPAVTGGQCLRNEYKPGCVLIAAIHPQQLVDANQQALLLQFHSRRNTLPDPPVIDRIELFDQQNQPVEVSVSAMDDISRAMPSAFQLDQNYPNPFNPATTISYQLQQNAHIWLGIYNATGQLVRTLVEGEKNAGIWQASWDGRNAAGEHLGSGIYFCRLQVDRGPCAETRKMVLMR